MSYDLSAIMHSLSYLIACIKNLYLLDGLVSLCWSVCVSRALVIGLVAAGHIGGPGGTLIPLLACN